MSEIRLRSYWRLSALSAGSALIVALLLLLGLRWLADRQMLLDEMKVQAELVGANITASVVFDDPRTATEIVTTLERSPNVIEATVYRADGSALARYQRARTGTPPVFGMVAPPIGHTFTMSEIRLAVPVVLEGKPVGTIALRATLDGLYRALGRFFGGMLAISVVAAALGHIASRRLRLRMVSAERELERMALYDPVTGLANRHAFILQLGKTLARHSRDGGGSALLYIDLDGFKKVNDLFGHAAGDQVLATVAERLTGALRGADLVGRLGGDEFAVLLTNTASSEAAERVAESLIQLGSSPIQVDESQAHVGFSIGIAMLPHDGDNAAGALRNADLAMYHAKQMGKNTYQFFSENLGNRQRRRLDIEAGLRAALSEDQFYVVYQPLRSARRDRIESLEALVRWRHPEWGIVSPGEFIPVAEDSGLIHDIGRTVLAKVCRDIVELRGAGRIVPPVAINVSAIQLMQGLVAEEIVAAIGDHQLPAGALEVELTESVLMERLGERLPLLERLTGAGIAIAIDDFGTGYSSLNYLRHLPVQKLKLDMSFVRDLPASSETLAVVRSIIDMAHALELRVVAEGVENADQADCLRTCGCDLLQGYHIGLPMRKQEIMIFLSQAG